MAFNITFVPTNSSHVEKNGALLNLLRQHGHTIKLLCLDQWSSRLYATLPSIRETDFDWEEVAPISISREARTIVRALSRRKIARGVKSWIQQSAPTDLFIFGADTGVVSRTFIRTARQFGIPSVLVLDGLTLPRNPDYVPAGRLVTRLRDTLGTRIYKLLYGSGPRGEYAELVLTINEISRQALIDEGLPKEKIQAVGSPEYDALATPDDGAEEVSQTAVREKLGIDLERPVVFYAHQGLAIQKDDYRRIVRKLAEGCARANAVLLVKFHPRGSENPAEWKQWAASEELPETDVVFVLDECSSIEAIEICSICVTAFSTVALEAVVNSRPLLILRYPNAEYILPYAQMYGAALDVFEEQELPESVARLVRDDDLRSGILANRAAVIDHELGGLDGKSAERSALAIEKLLSERTE